MPILIGVLFALGLAALLFALAASLPAVPLAPWVAPAAVATGTVCFGLSWAGAMARSAGLDKRLREASLRLDDWAADLRTARIALDEAERSLQAGAVGTELSPLLGELITQVEEALEHEGADAVQELLAAWRGIATESPPAPVTLDELVDAATRQAVVLAGHDIEVARSVEPHAQIAVDRARITGLLVQALLAADATATSQDDGPPVRLDVAEWQAGLLRIEVIARGARALGYGARRGGLLLAAAHAREMSGSLEWTDGTTGERRFVLLLPLAEEDAPTDPGRPRPE